MCSQTTTKHKSDCKMAFGRKDASCPRCQELLNGAEAIKWAPNRAERDARRSAEIRAHDCKKSNCGPVCTAFDW